MLFRLIRLVLTPAVWLFGRPVVKGREHLPAPARSSLPVTIFRSPTHSS